MSTDMILIIGATGLIGEPVARQLLWDGLHVRVFTRDINRAQRQLGPDFEYGEGDIDAVDALTNALVGCSGVHISLRAEKDDPDLEYRAAARIAELAAQHKVSRIAYVSGGLVYPEYLQGLPDQQVKYRAEQALRQSGVPYTIFKPTYFMETLPRHIQGKRAVVLGRQPHPLAMIAAADFGRMVSRAFRTPEAANREFPIRGPEEITISDALRIYCELVEPDKQVTSVPLWFMSIVDTLFMQQKLQSTIQLMRLMQRVGVPGDATVTNQVLGVPTTTVRQWCEQQRAGRAQKRSTSAGISGEPPDRNGEH